MSAPKNHPRWGNPLNPKKYTPEDFWNGACDYFEWCNKNPIMVVEQTKMPQKLSDSMVRGMKPSMIKSFLKQTIELPHSRAYSIEGLCVFLNMKYQGNTRRIRAQIQALAYTFSAVRLVWSWTFQNRLLVGC